jgi:hypothetical protein
MRSILFGMSAVVFLCGAASAERFSDPRTGLSIEKPDDWCVLSEEAIAQDRRTIEAANPDLRGKTRTDGYLPVFAFTRYAGSQQGLTSTVKIGTIPVTVFKGKTGQRLVRAMLSSLRSLMPDVKVLTAPEVVSLAGKDAGHMAVIYTLKTTGGSSRITGEMWAIRRGNYIVEVGATYPADDRTGDRAAVMEVVGSLQLAD